MPTCIQSCHTANGVEVFKVNAVDGGAYTSLLAVNWDANSTASAVVYLVMAGISPAAYYTCSVTNMWFPSIVSTVTNGLLSISKIPPNGNAALKIVCSRQGAFLE